MTDREIFKSTKYVFFCLSMIIIIMFEYRRDYSSTYERSSQMQIEQNRKTKVIRISKKKNKEEAGDICQTKRKLTCTQTQINAKMS